MKYLTNDDDDNNSQNKKRIPLFQLPGWDKIGDLMVDDIDDSGELKAPDLTKYQILIIKIKFFTP